MGYEIQESGSGWTLKLDGRWTIENASQLKTLLVDVLKGSDRVVLHLGATTEVDLACLQLFCAAHRFSLNQNKDFSLESELPEAFRKTVSGAGFPRILGCHKNPRMSCLWLGGWES